LPLPSMPSNVMNFPFKIAVRVRAVAPAILMRSRA
jgi:hypothetical protein